nr:integrase, catalytic region, zinc finger, CCHC-type, peptidase aspartic, catalytic [Tanacetum cinerariifolium]GEZ26889.1 integrase, catalytic region, zinc finger, CCHC-type, peptidase aspartic, catalytic [Tanacetum cinerariifolium]
MKRWEELIRENVFKLGGHRDHISASLTYMLYCIVAEEQYNLAYFFVNQIECAQATSTVNLPYGMFLTRLYRYIMEHYPYLDNGIYNVVDQVMRPLTLKQTQNPQSDHGKTHHSVSSTSAHHNYGSSSHQGDDDEDDGAFRASTPSPTTYLNSLCLFNYQRHDIPTSSQQDDNHLFERQTICLINLNKSMKKLKVDSNHSGSLADKAILSGADNRSPMLGKDMYDSWKSRMELYMLNRQHGRMILEFVESGPLLWPSIEENGVTRLKKYSELSPTEAIQADCDVKATNIILQGLPSKVYALVRTYKVSKDLWERIQMLMQGTSLTKQEREYKLYDEFDKFAYRKGESLRDYYLRFLLLLNDMNIYNMKLEQFQVNTKFLNTLPHEWSKFVTDVKLVRDLHTTNVDQLYAYLAVHPQSEFSPPDTRVVVLVFQHGDDPIDAINHMMVTIQPIQGRQNSMIVGSSRSYTSGSNGTSGKQRVIVCYNCKGEGHMSKQCTKPKRMRDE